MPRDQEIALEGVCHFFLFWQRDRDKIYNGNIFEQIEVYQIFEENFKVRNKMKMECEITKTIEMKQNKKRKRQKAESPCDPFVDPLHCKKSSIG